MHILSVLLIVLMFNKVYNYNMFPNKDKDVEKYSLFYANFLQMFRDFQIIFHTDNCTINIVDHVVKILNCKHRTSEMSSVLVYNYDTITEQKEFVRPRVSRTISVLFSDSSYIWANLASPQILNNNDVIVFSGGHLSWRAKIKRRGSGILKLAGNILVVENSEDGGISIYQTCYYCGHLSEKFVLLETIYNATIKTDLKNLLPDTFRNLNGHLLHTTFIQYYPFIYCRRSIITTSRFENISSVNCTELRGIESQLIKTISEKLNFTFFVHILDENVSILDMLMHINQSKLDMAFGGISISEERIPLVQFTEQYNSEPYLFLYVIKISFETVFDKFAAPFRQVYILWIMYLIAFLLLSFTVYLAFKVNRASPRHYEISFINIFWMLLRTPFEQSLSGRRAIFQVRISTAMMVTVWWWSSLILGALYKSTMLSAMVQPTNTEPQNLEELVKAGYRFVGNKQYADMVKELLNVNDPIYKEALRKTIFGKDVCDALSMILDGEVAMIDEWSKIQFEIRTICPEPDEAILDFFRTSRHELRSSGHAWALQAGAPYRPALDYYISLILSGGLFKKWRRDFTSKFESNLIPRSRELIDTRAKALSLKRLTPLLCIYSGGMCVSFICCMCEILIFKLNRRIKNIVQL